MGREVRKECILLNHCGTRHVHQNCIRLELLELPRADEILRLPIEFNRHDNDVCSVQYHVKIGQRAAHIHRMAGLPRAVDCADLHAESLQQAACPGANGTQADDGRRAARKPGIESRLVEYAVGELPVSREEILGSSQNHRHRVFGYWLGCGARVEGHTAAGKSGERKPVSTGCQALNETQPSQRA